MLCGNWIREARGDQIGTTIVAQLNDNGGLDR